MRLPGFATFFLLSAGTFEQAHPLTTEKLSVLMHAKTRTIGGNKQTCFI